MRNRPRLQRKIIIGACMALLLLPMSFLAQPGAADDENYAGTLAKMRKKERLAQSNLGEIDPTSEAMKLALLGLRGVWATVLWGKSHEYKEQENWAELKATLEQMTKLQPNFVSVWRFQGWNLAYNLSVEMDDYLYRYYWVTKGIEFIDRGQTYNDQDLMLLWDEGWTTAQKIGRADEVAQYRRLFSQDEFQMVRNLFGADKVDDWIKSENLDNWYVGRESFLDAVQMHDGSSLEDNIQQSMRLNVAIFMSEPTKCLMRGAHAREKEGRFGERAGDRWKRAYAEWTDGDGPVGGVFPIEPRLTSGFGERKFNLVPGKPTAALLDLQQAIENRDRLVMEMVADDPSVLGAIREEKLEGQREAAQQDESGELSPRFVILEKALEDFDSLSPLDKTMIEPTLPFFAEVTPEEVSRHPRVTENSDLQSAVTKLLPEANEAQELVDAIRMSIQLVNYEYWRQRCAAEANPLALDAREEFYSAAQAADQDQLTRVKELYASGFLKWRQLIDGDDQRRGFYQFMDDAETGHEMLEHLKKYLQALDKSDENFGRPQRQELLRNFVLKDLVRRFDPQMEQAIIEAEAAGAQLEDQSTSDGDQADGQAVDNADDGQAVDNSGGQADGTNGG
ncbi:MAG: hypothetical protein MPJ50_09465 [Pirellulales bacterium]|nr:hypothetical protein [Pirellulales bacterium]